MKLHLRTQLTLNLILSTYNRTNRCHFIVCPFLNLLVHINRRLLQNRQRTAAPYPIYIGKRYVTPLVPR